MPTLPPDDEPDEIEEHDSGIEPWPTSSVEVTETDNPIVGTLYDANGDVLVELRERRQIPFGYQR